MKKLLILALLVVGCAHKPPLATFYIGMTEDEFYEQNKDEITDVLDSKDGFITKMHGDSNTQGYQGYFDGDNVWSMNAYHYLFVNDTLLYVSRGALNYLLEKDIDYDKYTTPPE